MTCVWSDLVIGRESACSCRIVLPIVAMVAPLSLLGGCGLIFIPRVQSFPGPVRGITVVDAGDGAPIANARVLYEVVPYVNWVHFPPMLFDPDTDTRLDPRDPARTLCVAVDSCGTFTVEPCRMSGSIQWFFPIPSPLGWTLYRDFEARLTVSAPDYRELGMRYVPDRPPSAGSSRSRPFGSYVYDPNGVLQFRLVKKDSVKRSDGPP